MKKKKRERESRSKQCVRGGTEGDNQRSAIFYNAGRTIWGRKGKKKGCCLFDCVKATSSFMLIPIISEGEGATVAD